MDEHCREENALVRETLDLLQRRDQLRRDLEAGMKQLEEGKRIDGEKVFARLERRAAEIVRRANAADQ